MCFEFDSGQQWSPGYAAERGEKNCLGSWAKKVRFSIQIDHGMLALTWLAHVVTADAVSIVITYDYMILHVISVYHRL